MARGGAGSRETVLAANSFAGRRTGTLAAWVATAGFVAAALQLVAFIWLPSLAIPIWFLPAAATGVGTRASPAI